MPRKLTIEEMRKVAKARGWKCLSTIYLGGHQKLKWRCKRGHVWMATPSHVKFGTSCPYCTHHVKLTIDEMRRIAKSRSGFCLSKNYENKDAALQWQCKKGHTWYAIPGSVKRGTWCPHCSHRVKSTIREMKKLAKSRGGKCLSKKYVNSVTPLKWQCKNGYEWKATPGDIKMGRWCPHCSHHVKLTIGEMKKLAKSKGGRCLSDNYVNSMTKLKWRCEKGHIWKAVPASMKYGETWCPICSHRIKLTIGEMQKIAETRGGKCLSDKFVNSKTKLEWRCKNGHEWEAVSSNIKLGKWCPICSQGLHERICRKYFEGMFGKKFLHVRPKWLVARNGERLELDGYCKELKLAFEYQGRQHYLSKDFFQTKKDFNKRKEYDKLKKKLCKSNGITLVIVPFWVSPEKMGKYIIEQCEKHGINVPNKNVSSESFAFYYPEIVEELQEVANSRGGELLSKGYVSSQTKLKWRCKEGHEWEAAPASIKHGGWCPFCARNVKLSIEEMEKIAKTRGGRCLSEKYVNAYTKLRWQCKKGHVWYSAPNSVKNQKTWCPICGGSLRLTIGEIREFAKSRGGECLSNKYVNAKTKLKWKCEKGHVWEAVPNNIRNGQWCPHCSHHAKLTIGEMKELAKSMGGLCLSKTYVGNHLKLLWQCREGHRWEATPHYIKSGYWCPKCAGRKIIRR